MKLTRIFGPLKKSLVALDIRDGASQDGEAGDDARARRRVHGILGWMGCV